MNVYCKHRWIHNNAQADQESCAVCGTFRYLCDPIPQVVIGYVEQAG